jgi:hypothetical protein
MFQNRFRSAILVIALCLLPSLAGAQTVAADSFVDTAGVNTHLHYFDTPYGDFSLIRSRLIELGVRHVRDGLIDTEWQDYYARFQSLAQAGIKGTFIVSPNQSTELWAQYPARMGIAFEAYEAPNEYDRPENGNWTQTLRQTATRLRTLRNDPRSAAFPVLGPSLHHAESYSALGDLSAYFDAANMHNYLGGRHPCTPGWDINGYGSIAWNLNQIRPYTGGKPVITTETGFQDDPASPDAIPQDVAARYLPRVLLEQFRAGIARTYIYELIDWSTQSGHYGLLNQDGSPRPVFTAVKSLLNLLADPGPAFTPQNLSYTVQGAGADFRHMAFQKRDGTYLVAVWLGTSGYENETHQRLAVAAQTVTFTTATPMRFLRMHRWQPDGSLNTIAGVVTTSSIPVSISDSLTVIELTAASSPGPGPAPTPGILPGVPGTLEAAVYDRSVQLRWQAATDGSAPSGYVIEAAATADFANAFTAPVGLVTELLVPNVAPGTYFIRVRGTNGSGFGPPSNVRQVSVGVPEAPQLVAIQAAINPISLSWSPVAGTDHYVLSAGTSPGQSDLAVVNMGGATSVSAPAPPGVRLYVRVAAVNGYGGSRSNEVSFAVGTPQPPGAPTLQANVSGRHVALSWAAGPGNPPAGYVLVIGTSPGAADLVLPVGQATQIAGDSPIAGPFYIRVFAQNSAGATSSNEVSFSVP